LAFVSNADDPGLTIFPTHRLVRGINGPLATALTECGLTATSHDTLEDALSALDGLGGPGFVSIEYGEAGALLWTGDNIDSERSAAWNELDVPYLHRTALAVDGPLREQLDTIGYSPSLDAAAAHANAAPGNAAFLLRGAPAATTMAVARAGERLPQKTTYFYPKVPTGIAFRPLDAQV
jgi:hypothetical protein